MDNLLVLLLITIAQVQGYYKISNGSVSKSHMYNEKNLNEMDKVFEHYRSDSQNREPRFVSFQTKDDNVEVEIDFAIPFLSIPVKRSLSGAMGTIQNVISGIPMLNVNLGAILLTGFVILGGAMIGGIGRLLNGNNFIEVAGSFPWVRTGNKKQKNDVSMNDGSEWWRIIDLIDKALIKYHVDTTACTQRVICWYVKESVANVHEKKATNWDHIINGLISSDWALQLISTTAWQDAVTAGRQNVNCELKFSQCNLDRFTNYLRRK